MRSRVGAKIIKSLKILDLPAQGKSGDNLAAFCTAQAKIH